MRLTSKGQVTIPQKLRKQFGLKARTEVTFEARDDGVLIRPAATERLKAFKVVLQKTRGSANAGLSTDEIMRLTRGDD
jgi:antitoxin PrlF